MRAILFMLLILNTKSLASSRPMQREWQGIRNSVAMSVPLTRAPVPPSGPSPCTHINNNYGQGSGRCQLH